MVAAVLTETPIVLSGAALHNLERVGGISFRWYKNYLLWVRRSVDCITGDRGFISGGVLPVPAAGEDLQYAAFDTGTCYESIEEALYIAEGFVDSLNLQRAGAPEELYLSVLRSWSR